MTPLLSLKIAPRPCVIWFTGLSGAGKSTLAQSLAQDLSAHGYLTKLLDGDELRKGLCADLGYSLADREENNRRLGAVAKLFCDSGFIVLVAASEASDHSLARLRDYLRAGGYISEAMAS